MPRKPRFFLPEVPVHVVQRGHGREPVFFEDRELKGSDPLNFSDPIGLAGGLNTYGYALQNPIKHIDFEGLRVKWEGTFRSGGATVALGGNLSSYEFTSECKCNKRITVEGFASFTNLGAGGKGASSSDTTMYTPSECPVGWDFQGPALLSGIGVTILAGATFFPTLHLGNAVSERTWASGPNWGFDLSITYSIYGHSGVLNVKEEDCCE